MADGSLTLRRVGRIVVTLMAIGLLTAAAALLCVHSVAAQQPPTQHNGERGGYGTFCTLVERGCWRDCFNPVGKTFVTPPTTETYRTLPFGVGGCCSPTQDPTGSCTAGSCASQTCVNLATPNVHSFCPTAAAACQPCTPAQMDLDVCAAHCFDLGYAFSGVEYANQCTCGTHIPAWSKIDSSGMLCRTACANCEGGAQGDRSKECEHCKCPANQEQWCGGGCAVTIREVVCSWGSPFLLLFVFGTVAYVAIGIAYATKTAGKRLALQSHPHFGAWLEIHGLVMDGIQFSQARYHGTPIKPRTARRGEYGAVVEETRAGGKTKREKHSSDGSNKHEKHKKTRGKKDNRELAAQGPGHSNRSDQDAGSSSSSAVAMASLSVSAPAATSAGAAGTAAGDGGRWVRVPE